VCEVVDVRKDKLEEKEEQVLFLRRRIRGGGEDS
jgi:hypothetical protein